MKISGLFICITVILMVFGITATASSSTTGGLTVDWLSVNGANFTGYGTSATTATVGNDARLSDARTPIAHTMASHSDDGTMATQNSNSVAITEGTIGGTLYESTTGDIQTAIDTVAASSTINNLVISGDHTLSNILIHGDTKYIEFTGVITASSNNAALVVGNGANTFRNSNLKINKIIGDTWTGTTVGLKLQNSIRSTITVNNISTVKYGIQIYSLSFVNDNTINFNEIVLTNTGILFDSGMTENAEGNRFSGSIFGSTSAGLSINNGAGKSSRYTAYYGVIDNVFYPAAKDIVDTSGSNMFYMTFIQDSLNSSKNTIHPNSTMIEMGSARTILSNPIIKTSADPILKLMNENNTGWMIYQQNAIDDDFIIAQMVNTAWNRTDFVIDSGTGQLSFPSSNVAPAAETWNSYSSDEKHKIIKSNVSKNETKYIDTLTNVSAKRWVREPVINQYDLGNVSGLTLTQINKRKQDLIVYKKTFKMYQTERVGALIDENTPPEVLYYLENGTVGGYDMLALALYQWEQIRELNEKLNSMEKRISALEKGKP